MTELERKAYADAYYQKYRNEVILFYRTGEVCRADRRTRYGKLVVNFYAKIKITDKDKLIDKRKARLKLQKEGNFTPLFETPLVKDWRNNKWYCDHIYPDHLNFGQRNHWAKTATDYRFLRILRRIYGQDRPKNGYGSLIFKNKAK